MSDQQHEDDKVLHQDAIEEVIDDRLRHNGLLGVELDLGEIVLTTESEIDGDWIDLGPGPHSLCLTVTITATDPAGGDPAWIDMYGIFSSDQEDTSGVGLETSVPHVTEVGETTEYVAVFGKRYMRPHFRFGGSPSEGASITFTATAR